MIMEVGVLVFNNNNTIFISLIKDISYMEHEKTVVISIWNY